MGKHRREKRNACIGKTQFQDFQKALLVAQIRTKRDRYRATPFRAYKCRFCGGYHIGRTGHYRWY